MIRKKFICGSPIEIFDEKWLLGRVEHSMEYKHGYYFYQGKMPLEPGMLV